MRPFKSSKTKTDRTAKAALARQDLERRYAEHLAGLPPQRARLLRAAPPVDKNAALMKDCVETAAEFQRALADREEIQQICAGVSRNRAFISVFVKEGVDEEACQRALPEFFRGYLIRVHRGVAP